MDAGTGKGIRAQGIRQTGANRILQNVSHDDFCCFIVTKDALMIPGLPETLFRFLAIRETCCLLESFYKCLEIGLFRPALDKGVKMIWHRAVRKNCEVTQLGVRQKSIDYASRHGRISETSTT
jgi:hypothetical protein